MSATLFNIVIDWVPCRTTEDKPRGIRWTLIICKLEDLDFADDLALIALLSHTHNHLQEEKTTRLNIFGQKVGLGISTKKTDFIRTN